MPTDSPIVGIRAKFQSSVGLGRGFEESEYLLAF
jgi:hypothetical protein